RDAHPQSVVEGALDAFEVISLACDDPGPAAYCTPPGGNSVSPQGARLIHLAGQPGGVLTYRLAEVPLPPGILFFGWNAIDQPFGCARRCVGGAITRSNVYWPNAHSFEAVFDTTGLGPAPFRIQYW